MSKEYRIAEAPGLYGTFSVGEKLIQKIWNNGDFMNKNLQTLEGEKLIILNSGKWNLADEGPDFKGATISFDGEKISGDVEIHFEEKDWGKHGHSQDSSYANVILHVVLFPPEENSKGVASISKNRIPTVILLPLLMKSLEEYAEEHAIEKLAGIFSHKSLPAHFPGDWKEAREWSKKRWNLKCMHAQKRIDASGWEDACHQWFLEVLGYRRNRIPMARISQIYSIETWRNASINVEDLYHSQKDWKLKGSRPANHPQKRLEQYDQLIKKSPRWPKLLQKMDFREESSQKNKSMIDRKSLDLSTKEREFRARILGGVLGGNRVHTLMIDACLPLWSVYNQVDIFENWFHCTSGDVPENFRTWSRKQNLSSRDQPFCNGLAQAIIYGILKSDHLTFTS